MQIERTSSASFIIRVDYTKTSTFKIAWFSDLHFDSPYCKRDILKKHLDDAVKQDAYIVLGSDCFDLMQSKNDPRANKSDLAAQYSQRNDYINAIIEDFVEFFEPYKERILFIFRGNHETAMLERMGIDLTALAIDKLNSSITSDHRIMDGAYVNWIKILFKRVYTVGGRPGNYVSYNIMHSHSSGSMGLRSKGVLSADILAGKYPDADIIITEHNHDAYMIPINIEQLSDQARISWRLKWFLQLPSYKAEWEDPTRSNWWHRTNKFPRPVGHYMFSFSHDKKEIIKFNPVFIT